MSTRTPAATNTITPWLGSSGRVRIFGDPMQVIYNFGDEPLIPWDSISDDPGAHTPLEDPQRWPQTPDLSIWILTTREALRTVGCLPLGSAPDCCTLFTSQTSTTCPTSTPIA